jgi:hypothetical protein
MSYYYARRERKGKYPAIHDISKRTYIFHVIAEKRKIIRHRIRNVVVYIFNFFKKCSLDI